MWSNWFGSRGIIEHSGRLKGNIFTPLGPVKLSDDKISVKPNVWGELPKAKVSGNCSATGKLYGKICKQEKF
jgi:hypothetical protein